MARLARGFRLALSLAWLGPALPSGRAGAGPAAVAPAGSASTLTWLKRQAGKGIGPPGGEIRSLAAAPGDPLHLYAGTANGHLFASEDGAESWQACRLSLPAGAVIDALAVDPRASSTAYAAYWLPEGGGGVVRTRDGGASFAALPLPAAPSVRALAIAPSAPDTVFAGGPDGVWRSDDQGGSWTSTCGTGGAGEPLRMIESLAVDPARPSRLYAGTWRQPYRSQDGGATWSLIGRGMAVDRDVFTLVPLPPDGAVILAGTCGFLYASKDGGDQWSVRQAGIAFPHRRIQALAVPRLWPEQIWAGTRGGLYRSGDGGKSFELRLGGVSVSALDVDPAAARILAATEELGVIVSRDGRAFAESNAGLDASRVIALDALPGDLRTVFAARAEGPETQSIQLSSDAGQTWSRLGPGSRFERVVLLRARARPAPEVLVVTAAGSWSWLAPGGRVETVAPPPGRVVAVEVAPASSLALVAATSAGLFATAPAPSEPRRPGTRGAAAWRRLSGSAVTALAVEGDRFLAAGPGVLVRGLLGLGLAVQELRPAGLPGGVVALALSPAPGTTAYAATRGQVLRSDDLGATWRGLPLPWPPGDLRAIAVDPSEPTRVLAVDFSGAVYRGTERGEHWRVLDQDPGLRHAHDIRMGAAAPGLALIATLGQGVRVLALGDPPDTGVRLVAKQPAWR